ncbi:helix-turn-helix domain-containing protein [Micromonospora carbonacea]|uniref:helix-turn-helix domain-containing protein n=1 Tax=Micromonospora carbonacea TaxID=47853 RepID=UPI003D746BA4
MDPQGLSDVKRALGRRLGAWRRKRGLTQDDVARLVHSTRSTVANVESGRQVVDRVFWAQCESLLRAGGELLTGYDEYRSLDARHQEEKAEAARHARWGALASLDPAAVPGVAGHRDEVVEPVAEVQARVRDQHAYVLDESFLDAMEAFVTEVVDSYELRGPRVLAPLLVRERRRVQPMLMGRARPRQQQRLLAVAGRLSGLLSYMSVNLGRFDSARAYALECFQLAEQADDPDLQAWVRGTQSLAEFYAGNYRDALAFAQDGRRFAGTGRQAVRLAVNGEARAHGRLGDRRAVEKTVGDAYDLLAGFSTEPGMTPCISFGVYSEARTASNAATAHLGLGNAGPVLQFAGRALDIVDSSPSRWSQALVRLDMASALLDTPTEDLDQALALARAAMAAAEGNRIESIEQRLRSFAAGLQGSSDYAPVAAFTDEVRQWLRERRTDNDTPF